MDEMKIIITFLFKRSGEKSLTQSEIYLPLSIDLKWFTPNQAKDFLNQAIKQKLLVKKGEFLTPGFDMSKVEVPLNYFPTKQIFEGEKKVENQENIETSTIERLIDEISKKTSLTKEEVNDKIRVFENKKNIVFEVAALLLAKENEIEYDDFLKEIENNWN